MSKDDSYAVRKAKMAGILGKAPKELGAIADVILRYRPKPKSDAAKKRKRKARKAAKNQT